MNVTFGGAAEAHCFGLARELELVLGLHLHHLDLGVLVNEFFNMTIAAADADDELAVEDLGEDFFGTEHVVAVLEAPKELTKSSIIDECRKLFINCVTLHRLVVDVVPHFSI